MDVLQLLFFYLVALVAIVSGLFVVFCKNPVNNAIALVNTFFCLAVFYVMLYAPFMAAIQVLVYAGAIMVLIVFVIMLLNLGTELRQRYRHALAGAGVGAALLFFELVWLVQTPGVRQQAGEVTPEVVNQVGHTELIAKTLFAHNLLPFEIASVLLLVAMVGAVIIAKREV